MLDTADFLRLADELFPALRAGNGDLAFLAGYPHLLLAARTVKIPMLTILETLDQHKKFPIFLVALIGFPGKTPENRPEQKNIRNSCQRQSDVNVIFEKHCHNTGNKTNPQQQKIQFITAVAAGHKAL